MITSLRLFANTENTSYSGVNISKFVNESSLNEIALESESDIIGDFDLGELEFSLSLKALSYLGLNDPTQLKYGVNVRLFYYNHIIFYGPITKLFDSKRFDTDYVDVRADSIARHSGNWPLVPEKSIIDNDPTLQSLLKYDYTNDVWRFLKQGTVKEVFNAAVELANYSIQNAYNYGYIAKQHIDLPFKLEFRQKEGNARYKGDIPDVPIDLDDINFYNFSHFLEITDSLNFRKSNEILEREIEVLYQFREAAEGLRVYIPEFSIGIVKKITTLGKLYTIYTVTNAGLQLVGDRYIIFLNKDSTTLVDDLTNDTNIFFYRVEDFGIFNIPQNLKNYVEAFMNIESAYDSIQYFTTVASKLVEYGNPNQFFAIVRSTASNKLKVYQINIKYSENITVNYDSSSSIKEIFRNIAELTNKILRFEFNGSITYHDRDKDDVDIILDRGTIIDIQTENLDFNSSEFSLNENIIISDDAQETVENEQNRHIAGFREKNLVELFEKWNQLIPFQFMEITDTTLAANTDILDNEENFEIYWDHTFDGFNPISGNTSIWAFGLNGGLANYLRTYSGGRIILFLNGIGYQLETGVNFGGGDRHSVRFVKLGTSFKVYVDGVYKNEAIIPSGLGMSLINILCNSTTNNRYAFIGKSYEFKIWSGGDRNTGTLVFDLIAKDYVPLDSTGNKTLTEYNIAGGSIEFINYYNRLRQTTTDPKALLFKTIGVNDIFTKSLIKSMIIKEDSLILNSERLL